MRYVFLGIRYFFMCSKFHKDKGRMSRDENRAMIWNIERHCLEIRKRAMCVLELKDKNFIAIEMSLALDANSLIQCLTVNDLK